MSATAIVRNSVKSKPLPIPPTKIEIVIKFLVFDDLRAVYLSLLEEYMF